MIKIHGHQFAMNGKCYCTVHHGQFDSGCVGCNDVAKSNSHLETTLPISTGVGVFDSDGVTKAKFPYSPPAFPQIDQGDVNTSERVHGSSGMTIRQHYAASIMNGLVTKWGIEQVNDAEIMRVFSIADRMAKFEKDGN
jgi:hypothetical protein